MFMFWGWQALGLCAELLLSPTEYDQFPPLHRTMAAAYLDPNLNHTPNSSTKTYLNVGAERSPGAMERVLKVFHYFESSSEPTTWASIIRHGDATDIRVRAVGQSFSVVA